MPARSALPASAQASKTQGSYLLFGTEQALQSVAPANVAILKDETLMILSRPLSALLLEDATPEEGRRPGSHFRDHPVRAL